MPRPCSGLRAALPMVLASVLVVAASGCTGSGDPTSPVQPGAEGTYVHATFTLLDAGVPCRPGVVCDPEFLDCDGNNGFTVPKTWTLDADTATVGVLGYVESEFGSDARGIVVIRAADTSDDLGVAFAIDFSIANATGVVSSSSSARTQAIFANVDTRCTRLNGNRDYVTMFGVLPARPRTGNIDFIGVSGGEAVFARPDGAGLTPDYVEGTFSFTARNLQQFGQVYQGEILVEGCFRVQVPEAEQGVELDPSASPGC